MPDDTPQDERGRTLGAPFPTTHWSVLKAPVAPGGESDARRRSLEFLAKLYWRPIYAYFRLRWQQSREEAEDLTQNFFAWMSDSPLLDRADPGQGKFRNFVRTHLDNFMRNEARKRRRLRRGGERKFFSIDASPDPDGFLADAKNLRPEEILDHHWRLAITNEAITRLQQDLEKKGKETAFEIFRRYDLADAAAGRPTYADLAASLGIKPTDVDNHLASARKGLYQMVRDILAESVDGPAALQSELEVFFQGIRP